MLRVKGAGTSHMRRFEPDYEYLIRMEDGTFRSPFEVHLDGFADCRSEGGLIMMNQLFEMDYLDKLPDSSRKTYRRIKQKQFLRFSEYLSSGDANSALLVCLSNDWKCFLTDHKGHMLPLMSSSYSRWSKLSGKEKANYDAFAHKPLLKESRLHLECQFLKYEEILKPILAKSNLESIYHSSVLERMNSKYPYLPFYFAILNSFLKKYLKLWNNNKTFVNKNGKPIRCNFINVADQFHLAENPIKLFIKREVVAGGELTHRTHEAYDKLAAKWRKPFAKFILKRA